MQNIPDCFRFLFETYGRDILLNEKKFYAQLIGIFTVFFKIASVRGEECFKARVFNRAFIDFRARRGRGTARRGGRIVSATRRECRACRTDRYRR